MGRIGRMGLIIMTLSIAPAFAQEAQPLPEGEGVPAAVATLVERALKAPGPTETVTPEGMAGTDTIETATPLPVTPTPTFTVQPPAQEPTTEPGTPATPISEIATPTETVTVTASPTATPTATPTVTPTSTPGIFAFSVDPKPLRGKAHARWELTMPAERVAFKVYTSSFRLVCCQIFTRKEHPARVGTAPVELEWEVADDRGKPLTPGTYFFYLIAKAGKQSWEARDQAVVP